MPGTQITESEGHQWPPPKTRKGKKEATFDRGGPFRTTKSYVASPTNMPYSELSYTSPNTPNILHVYQGPLLATIPGDTTGPVPFPPTLESSDSDLDKIGAVAISRCKPTNSVADLSTFLGELMKEGLPSLVGSQTWKARTATERRKAVGGEYLNYQFGIAPVVSEVSNIAKAIRTSDKVLSQYERDAGRNVRRRYKFPKVKTRTETIYAVDQFGPFMGSGFTVARNAIYGKVVKVREVERSQWFSGCFTYHLPAGYESRSGIGKLATQADKLFGVSPTPETLWNLAPWSWAIDWFSNTGDVISNLQDFKLLGLVMRYGYVMEHTIVRDTYTFVRNDASSIVKANVSSICLVTETKKRRAANPFGFGVTWNGISTFQASIAAALGISRGR